MYCGSKDHMMKAIEHFIHLGATDWTFDTSRLEGTVRGIPAESHAHMAFNYQLLPGIEYELLYYEGDTRWDPPVDRGAHFISHLSYHVNDIAVEIDRLVPFFGHPVQMFETHDHTNDQIKDKKRFREVIFNTRLLFGHDIKLIQRIPWGDG